MSASQVLSDLRLSVDSDRSQNDSPPVHINGANGSATHDSEDGDVVSRLQRELERTREEKEHLATQYRNLLAKLTQMRTTLGNKLRQDAVQQLTAQNDDLNSTVETLKEELITSHEEAERTSNELDNLQSLLRERELRETQTELERCRIERDEWERQSVLQDFQAAKEHELRQAVKDYDSQLIQATQSLAEYKHRALTAEDETRTNTTRTQELEKEVKEKTLLIGKLRHEAVIINEHLMEALRRLRRSSSDNNVDRRLVTNVLLSFLTTPRADPKRFEILSLMATVLSWTDPEREKAGLQRTSTSIPPSLSSSFWTRSSSGSLSKNSELQKTDETESFSRLWVEFLLTEAAAGESGSSGSDSIKQNNSLPGSPTNSPSSPTFRGARRLSSFTSACYGKFAQPSIPSTTQR
ncbi:hypothetical protein F5146DRAFT_1102471 [Armillaria mellea]|nr:hypothetical protein F5146DRAFT_1102471 [Armillaria mellea]